MSRLSNPDLFIKTLTKMWEDDCISKSARRNRDVKKTVRHFIDNFQPGFGPPLRVVANKQPLQSRAHTLPESIRNS